MENVRLIVVAPNLRTEHTNERLVYGECQAYCKIRSCYNKPDILHRLDTYVCVPS
jgi:hypothetical protein